MLLVDKEILDDFNSSDYKHQIIDFYNKGIMTYIDDNTIQVNKKLLAQLLRDSYKLNCLEAGGVDNWSYYSEALNSRKEYAENYWDYTNKSDSEIIKDFIE